MVFYAQSTRDKQKMLGRGGYSNSFHPKDRDRTRHLDTRKGILRGRKRGWGVAGDTPNSKQQLPAFSSLFFYLFFYFVCLCCFFNFQPCAREEGQGGCGCLTGMKAGHALHDPILHPAGCRSRVCYCHLRHPPRHLSGLTLSPPCVPRGHSGNDQ